MSECCMTERTNGGNGRAEETTYENPLIMKAAILKAKAGLLFV